MIDIDLSLSFEQNAMREMIRNNVPFPLYVGGYGCGKSYAIVTNVIDTLFFNDPFDGCKIGVYSPTYKLIKKNLVPKFKLFLDGTLKGKIPYTYNKTDLIIFLSGGKEIQFFSTDDPGSLVGYDHYQSHSDESDTQATDKAIEVHKNINGRNRQVHPQARQNARV